VWTAQLRSDRAALPDGAARPMTLAEARPLFAALGDLVPPELRDRHDVEAEAGWAAWMTRRDADIRARVAIGDEDSVINLMLYGTRFTRRPRATPDAIASAPGRPGLEAVMDGRALDLAAAIESPAGDERLQFARQVVERHGIDVGPGSREATRRYLVGLRSRVLTENERYVRRLALIPGANESQRTAAQATVYRDRGLSSDTSLRTSFALEQAIAALRDRGELGPVRQVAIVGPGLDFIDKAQGDDFHAVQTIQPFTVADTLLRLRVSDRPVLTALDISPRVIAHLRGARERASRGEPYRLTAVLERDRPGLRVDTALVDYWRRVGDRVGAEVAIDVPAGRADRIRGRAIAVRPEVVLDVTAAHLNIVLERLDKTTRFDLAIATNVLVYYDTFEQALAVGNMVSMLRDRGLLLTNRPVPVPSSCGLSPVLIIAVDFGRFETQAGAHDRGDAVYVYRKVGQ
jgi:hypothetical protein